MVAHPERNEAVMRKVDALEPFVEEGCLFQLTAAAVIGEFGRRAFRTAQAILERGWDSVVASDAHDTHLRPSRMREAFKFLKAHYGRQTAERLMVQGPERLLAERAMLRLDGGWLLAH
jgi:putative capsular polysaccharide biosynthesis protein